MMQKGYSLIELLIVIAIIGILVAMAIPNLLDAQDRAKQRSSIAELRSWGTALGAYVTEKGVHPPQPGSGLASGIHTFLVPYAVSSLHDNDKWNHPFRYQSDNAAGNGDYTIASYGKDGLAPGGVLTPPTTWFDYNGDLILSDGLFVGLPG